MCLHCSCDMGHQTREITVSLGAPVPLVVGGHREVIISENDLSEKFGMGYMEGRKVSSICLGTH